MLIIGMVGNTTITRMPILSCRLLLLLTMVVLQPFLAVAGRNIPVAAPMVSTASSTPTPQIELSTAAAAAAALTADDQEFSLVTWKRGRHYQDVKTIYGHRLLLGSAPPSCQGKCGSCVPCSPIHISLGGPHGSLTQQEYYPEAWRCKCGNSGSEEQEGTRGIRHAPKMKGVLKDIHREVATTPIRQQTPEPPCMII